jgi:hypothetical protein
MSQYEWGTRFASHLTQLVEPITAYQLPVLLCFENEQNSEIGLMYFAPNLLYHTKFSVKNAFIHKVNSTQNISRIYSTFVFFLKYFMSIITLEHIVYCR